MGRIFTVVPDARACARVLGARVDGAWWRARVRTTCGAAARAWSSCVRGGAAVQRRQGLRSVTPSPHAAGAQRLTQLRVPGSTRGSVDRLMVAVPGKPLTECRKHELLDILHGCLKYVKEKPDDSYLRPT